MVVLRAGLCPGLTEEMIQVLRANGVRTGKMGGIGVGNISRGASRGGTVLCPHAGAACCGFGLFRLGPQLLVPPAVCSGGLCVVRPGGCLPEVLPFLQGNRVPPHPGSELSSLLGWAFFFLGGEPTASIGVPKFPQSLLEVSLHPPGAGCGETSAAGPVLGLPCQRGRSLRGAQELHGHPAHREPQVGTAPGERPWPPCLWGGGGALEPSRAAATWLRL